MQHGIVLKKLNFGLLAQGQRRGGGGVQANYLLDNVVKKLTFDLLTPSLGLGWGGSVGKHLLQCCCIRDSL